MSLDCTLQTNDKLSVIDADWNALYVDGEWTSAEIDETISVEDPLTCKTVVEILVATEADIDIAYEATAAAHEQWKDASDALF